MCSVWPSKLSAALGRSVARSLGKEKTRNTRSSPSIIIINNPLADTTSSPPLQPHSTISDVDNDNTSTNNNTDDITMSIFKSPSKSLEDRGSPTKSSAGVITPGRDLVLEARSFTSSLSHVFLMKKPRGGDHQVKQLLDRAQSLIEALVTENQRLQAHVSCRHLGSPTFHPHSPTSRTSRGVVGSMGQLWVKLDELKRENEELRRQRGLRSQDSSPLKDKAPGDVILGDFNKTKTDNETLKTQASQLQKNLRDLQALHAGTQEDHKRVKAALEAAQRSVEKARADYRRLEASVEVLKSCKTENDVLKSELDTLKHRLSNNVKSVSRTDNRLTENLNERCRPSNIAMRYNALESQQWVDAKEAVEDSGNQWEEGKIVHVLCQGLMSTYAAAVQLYTSVEFVISELLRRPTLAVSIIQSCLVAQCPASGHHLPDDLSAILKQRLRQTADNVDSDVIVNLATANLESDTKASLQSLSSLHAVTSYLRHCASITWQMAVQNPPMTLGAGDVIFDDAKHKLWWSCDQSQARKVDMFVWPVLYDYEKGNVLVKGCVCAS